MKSVGRIQINVKRSGTIIYAARYTCGTLNALAWILTHSSPGSSPRGRSDCHQACPQRLPILGAGPRRY
jgi:hypothetical protein